MKRKVLSILLSLCMVLTMVPTAFAVEDSSPKDIYVANDGDDNNEGNESAPVKTLGKALEKASDGDNIHLRSGTYTTNIDGNGSLSISKAVNLCSGEGAVIQGSVIYKSLTADNSSKKIAVSGITFEPGDDGNRQGLCLSTGVDNYTLNVEGCAFNGWQYGIGINSAATGNTLKVDADTTFTNTGCATSVKAGNTVEQFDAECDGYVVQYFNGNYGKDNEVNGYYETFDSYKNDVSSGSYTPDISVVGSGSTTVVFTAEELQQAVNSGKESITLAKDIELTGFITVADDANITINGNGNTISFPTDNGTGGNAAFSKAAAEGNMEGVRGVTMTFNQVGFKGLAEANNSGFAVIVGNDSFNTALTFEGCTFENLYCGAAYVNPITKAPTGEQKNPQLTINNSTFTNTQYVYSVDDGATSGAVTNALEVKLGDDNNYGNATLKEDFSGQIAATVTSNDVTKAYSSWETAYAAANTDDTITLQKEITGPITIDKAVTIEGNGKTITAENGDAITVTAAGVTLNGVNATAEGGNALGHALVVGAQDAKVEGDITINGGSYVAEHTGMQGEGAIRIFASGAVTVKDTATIGGIHVFDADSYAITGNNVSFTYDGDTPYVGILMFYTNKQDEVEDSDTVAGGLVGDNTIAVPNTSSIYAQVVNGGWDEGSKGEVSATSSVAKIGNNYYKTLQDAVDAVENNDTITVVANCSETVTVSRVVTFSITTKDEAKFTGSISAGSGYRVTQDGKKYTVEKYTPTGGGGGSVTTYAVNVEDTDNGTVTVSVKSASKGSTVTLTVKPDEGYQLDKLTVTDKDGKEISVTEKEDSKYTFTMPASEVSVSAAFTKSEEKPEQIAGFTDVLTTDWFADAVQYAVDNGMMNGTSETTFRPNGTTTRGMIVTILYRLEKEPAVDNGAGFADVAADQYYADAVAWASANDIVTGYSEKKFGPDDSITREQFAAILYRYAQYKKIDVTATADLSGYADAAQISAYAETAMKWANGEGLITGVTDTMLKPAGNATRAQAATILMRFCEEVAK